VKIKLASHSKRLQALAVQTVMKVNLILKTADAQQLHLSALLVTKVQQHNLAIVSY